MYLYYHVLVYKRQNKNSEFIFVLGAMVYFCALHNHDDLTP